jgi:hypothetical protein
VKTIEHSQLLIALRRCSSGIRGLVAVIVGAYPDSVTIQHRRRLRATRRASVLIVADDPLALEIYAELFTLRGYAVVTAVGARDGLRCARATNVTLAILALATGAASQLRRRLLALRPTLGVHVAGSAPPHDSIPQLRTRLH